MLAIVLVGSAHPLFSDNARARKRKAEVNKGHVGYKQCSGSRRNSGIRTLVASTLPVKMVAPYIPESYWFDGGWSDTYSNSSDHEWTNTYCQVDDTHTPGPESSFRFFSIPRKTAHEARHGGKQRKIRPSEYSSHFYSVLGARIIAGPDLACNLAQVFLGRPSDQRLGQLLPNYSGVWNNSWWGSEVVPRVFWINYNPSSVNTPPGKGKTPVDILADLGKYLATNRR